MKGRESDIRRRETSHIFVTFAIELDVAALRYKLWNENKFYQE